MPRDLDEDWDAGKVVAKLAPKDGAAEVEHTAPMQNRAVLALDEAILGTKIDRDGLAKKITTLEKEYVNATKDSSGAALTAKQLEVAKQVHEDLETARVTRAEAATVTAGARLEEMEQVCLGHIAAWEKQLEVRGLRRQRGTLPGRSSARRCPKEPSWWQQRSTRRFCLHSQKRAGLQLRRRPLRRIRWTWTWRTQLQRWQS